MTQPKRLEPFSPEWTAQRKQEEQDNLAQDPLFYTTVPVADGVIESKDGFKLSVGMTVYGEIRGHGIGPQVIKRIYRRYMRDFLDTVSDLDFGGCNADSVYFNNPKEKTK